MRLCSSFFSPGNAIKRVVRWFQIASAIFVLALALVLELTGVDIEKYWKEVNYEI